MKKFGLLLLISTFIFILSGCTFLIAEFDQSYVEEFGNVHFYDSGLIGCIDWLEDGDEMYYFVSSYTGNVKLGDALGAFNTDIFGDKHGYTLYSLEGDEYKGIAVLVERKKIETVKWLYVSKEADVVPTSFLFDIPHKDDWLFGGRNFKINDVTYSTYGSTKLIDEIVMGEEAGVYENTTYYEVVGYPGWICSANETDDHYIDLHYDVKMTELPVKMVRLIRSI